MTRPSDRAIAQAFWEIRPSVACDAVPFRRSVIDRATELDATAAPVVVGEDMVLRACNAYAEKMAETYGEGEAASGPMRAALTAALAGD